VPEAPLHIRALGDVWHPSAGYVDEALVHGITQIEDLLAFPYDFAGLVHFEAVIAGISVIYNHDYYQLTGPSKLMQQLRTRLQVLNAYPDAQPLVLLTT